MIRQDFRQYCRQDFIVRWSGFVLPFLFLFAFTALTGQDAEKAGEGTDEKPVSGKESPAEGQLSPLEQKFVNDLTNATLTGRWRLVKEGELGEEKEDKYTIRSVAKLGGDFWVIRARIQYGNRDVTVPVPVKVFWGGDTPIISVTKIPIPGVGTYTARVMIYDGLYTGAWFGPGHGGFLSGTIEKKKSGQEKEKE